MTVTKIPKLPVWKTIADVYIVTARHLGDLIRIAWPWLVLLIALSAALYAAYYDTERAATTGGTSSSMLWILTLTASTIIGALIAVPWHRSILLGEHQTLSHGLALDSRKFAYVAKAVAIIASLLLPLVAVTRTGSAEPESDAGTKAISEFSLADFWPVLFFLLFFALIFALNRLSLILPATAVDNRDATLRTAWRATRGNTLRLAFVSVVATFLPCLFPLGLGYLLAPAAIAALDANTAPNVIAFAVANTINEFLTILFGMLFVTFLSLAYRHFFGTAHVDASGTIPPDQPDAS